ncbi:S-formylglutathione hydrolase [Thalassotalea sp. PP2-459]|uniref:S-formylglutathione hydrolase n=1 Tax=Thalassotalea sp. PP2-459 TaxID=1742724 RepID=UPI000943E7C0|nr:S-formylglutathione hydrolase [Thalassotalea sp. PP2-459]OKY25150.1 S-formylglutathione hydrolase [Thalassotalea sp. PP2-459]
MEQISQAKVCEGVHQQFTHFSTTLQCTMRLAIFLPPNANADKPVPVLYWLSGLTCTDENFMQKAGAFKKAAELGVAIVAPDTSPRGENVANDDAYDLGQGAGFYVNATQSPWSEHYQMYDYIVHELPRLIEQSFPVTDKRSIAGHSMGGHGALVIGLRNQDQYQSISAFSPITNPSQCPWGEKAFSAYLGDNKNDWLSYDACHLLAQEKSTLPILVDQGDADNFLAEQLKPKNLQRAAQQYGSALELRTRAGYDHSYYFISSFIDEHLAFHHRCLQK